MDFKTVGAVIVGILATGAVLNWMGNSGISQVENTAKYVTRGYGV